MSEIPSVNYDPFSSFGNAPGGEPLNIPSVQQVAQMTALPSFVKQTLSNQYQNNNNNPQTHNTPTPDFAQANGGYGQYTPMGGGGGSSIPNTSVNPYIPAQLPQPVPQYQQFNQPLPQIPVAIQAPQPTSPATYIPKQLGADDILSAVKTLSGAAITQIQQQIQEYAEAQRLAEVLRERVQQGCAIKNPLSKQILVILNEFDATFTATDRIVYALETEAVLAKILSDPSAGLSALYSTKTEIVALLQAWFTQVSEECLNPYSQWAGLLS